MFSEIIKMCYIQWYNSYLSYNNGKYNQNMQHILYILYNNMENNSNEYYAIIALSFLQESKLKRNTHAKKILFISK